MSNINLQMQDHQGNILHPETNAELVQYKAGNVNDVLVELEDREQVFVQEVEPADDGLWVDTSDQTVRPNEENPVVTQVKKHINDFKEEVNSQLNEIENNIYNSINIKMYGVVGDGITDDGVALQKAIDDAISNRLNLISDFDNVIASSKSIIIKPVNGKQCNIALNFNNSTIKAINGCETVLTVDCKEYGEYGDRVRGISIKLNNIRLDCNNIALCGFYSRFSEGLSVNNISVDNVSNVGIYVDGGTILLDKFVINGDDGVDTIGLKVKCGDSIFTRGNINRCHVSIYSIYGALNLYDNIHGWVGKNFRGSAFLINEGIGSDIESSSFTMNNIYADSYQYVIKANSKSPITINNLMVYFNKWVYTDTSITPYVIYCNTDEGFLNNSSDCYEACMAIMINNGTLFKHPNILTYYTNVDKKYMKNNSSNFTRFLADKKDINRGTLKLNNDYKISDGWRATNDYYVNNGFTTVNFDITTEQGFRGGQSYMIGTITDWYFQSENTINFLASVGGNGGSVIVPAYVNGDDGKIFISLPDTVTSLKTSCKGSVTFKTRMSPLIS